MSNQASEDELENILDAHAETYARSTKEYVMSEITEIERKRRWRVSDVATFESIQSIIRTEKLKLLEDAKVLIKAGGYEASYEISMIEKLEAEL